MCIASCTSIIYFKSFFVKSSTSSSIIYIGSYPVNSPSYIKLQNIINDDQLKIDRMKQDRDAYVKFWKSNNNKKNIFM